MLGHGGDRSRRASRSLLVATVAALTLVPGVTASAQDPPDDSTTTTSTTSTTITTTTTVPATTTTQPATTTTVAPTTTAPVAPTTTAPAVAPATPAVATQQRFPHGCSIDRPLAPGATGAAVQCLQKAINADRAVDIRIDGTYGASTTSAVRDFQAAVRLPVTGKVDAATATRYRIWAGPATATPKPVPAKGCVTRVLSVYMSGADVSCLQKRINADRAADIAVTGVFDGATYRAVRDFQAAVRLPVTGIVDAATATRYGIWGGPAKPPPAPKPPASTGCVKRQLSSGATGADVSCLQKRINADRAADIAVTGVFDGATVAAVMDFQAAVGLPVTGAVDPRTAQRYGIWGGGAITTPPPPAAGAQGLPANSGSGRRVVYSRTQQRVWAVDGNGRVVKTHLVSGRRFEPYAGTYHVYSRSMYTYSTANPTIKWRYMVRFAYGPSGGRIGFHEIPNRYGVPLQSVRQLGQPLSGGCVRQSTADAVWMWNWAGVGTKVVVL